MPRHSREWMIAKDSVKQPSSRTRKRRAHLGSPLCKSTFALLVHFSTDYIFDGTGARPYPEDHPANPINYYGVTKWEGEKLIAASGCRFLIVRTSWIFGRNGENFVKKILKRALAGASVRRPSTRSDRPPMPSMLRRDAASSRRRRYGCLPLHQRRHRAAATSRHRTILQLYGLNNSVEPVKNDSLPTAAKRPQYSVLDCTRYTERTGHTPRTWQESTAEYIAFLKENHTELRS